MADLDIKVLGGLEITVEFESGYEDGECGHPGHYVEEWHISHISGRKLRSGESVQWLYDRIEKSGEEQKIVDACAEQASEQDYGDY